MLAFILGAGCVGLVAYMAGHLHDRVIDSMAEERVAHMMTQYMEWHAGAWPRSWDDLEDPALVCAQGWDFDDLRRRVDVNFTVDPTQLTKSPPPEEGSPSKVLWQRSGKVHCLNGVRPNRFIWNYLQERARRPPDYRPPKPLDPSERSARHALLALRAWLEFDSDGHVTEIDGQISLTDTDLKQLRNLVRLRHLNLYHSPAVTEEGIRALEQALPQCKVDRPMGAR